MVVINRVKPYNWSPIFSVCKFIDVIEMYIKYHIIAWSFLFDYAIYKY